MENLMSTLQQWLTIYGLRVLGALIILFVGWWAAKAARGVLRKVLAARDVDPTLASFATNLTYAMLVVFVVIAALNKLGIQTASLIAVLGAAGLAVGFALQGSLANFAAGLLIILFKPFKVGDVIEGAGVLGTVEDLDIFTTHLRSFDNKTIVVPNGNLTSGTLTNYSAKDTRRVDMVFGVSYGDDIPTVKRVIQEVLAEDGRILEDPAPMIVLLELGDSSVNFGVRPWVKAADYWDVYFELQEKMKIRFDREGITIPFPQRDVHLFREGDEEEGPAAATA